VIGWDATPALHRPSRKGFVRGRKEGDQRRSAHTVVFDGRFEVDAAVVARTINARHKHKGEKSDDETVKGGCLLE
jgi:hypothetical protein